MPGPEKETNSGATEVARALLRNDEESELLRHRLERPARLGRVGLGVLGATTVGAGVGVWLASESLPGIALLVFGAVLILLGVTQHLLLGRDRAFLPEQVLLWEEGLELVLHNGEVRGLAWSDPKLAFDLVARRAPPPTAREYLLVWMPDAKIPSIELSADGFEALRAAAVARRLVVAERRTGRRARETLWVAIRQSSSQSAFGQGETPQTPASR